LITGEELARTAGVEPCELVEGRIVRVSPGGFTHSLVTANAFRMLDAFARSAGVGRVLTGEVGFYTRRDPDTVRGADVVFISNERSARRTATLTFPDVAPELVVEVLSAEDRVMDLGEKLREYFTAGGRLAWVVDPRARSVHVYRSLTDLRVLTQPDSLSGEDVLPGFTASVSALFDE
jgi:Uma2 family endonuclease